MFHHGGHHLTTSIVRRVMWNANETMQLPELSWHMLRHTFASALATRGVPIRVVQDLMGHASILMTQRYSHLSPADTQNAIAALAGFGSSKAIDC